MPLEPPPNGMKLSLMALVGASHRDGSNFSGDGKMSGFRCSEYACVHTVAPPGRK